MQPVLQVLCLQNPHNLTALDDTISGECIGCTCGGKCRKIQWNEMIAKCVVCRN